MRLTVLALDYDGTIAEQDALHPDVRRAIDEARGLGVAVVLVTGRILDDLHHVAGDLRLFDAVVGENGATLVFPDSGRSLVLAPPPPSSFLDELRRREIPCTVGECVVEADAAYAHAILDVIRDLQLPLALLFNRGRLMVLPQGISKATGFRTALRALRLSEHNAVAIGDAENDHAMLAACELGVAVAWGSPALQVAADEVVEGSGPAAVAAYLRDLTGRRELPAGRSRRHHVLLGVDDDGRDLALAVRGRNVLVVGDPRTGKSWVAGLLAEQLILQRYSLCIIDPEGDYLPLQALPGVLVLGGSTPPPRLTEITRAVNNADVSVIVDLSRLTHDEKRAYVATLLPLLEALRARGGLPHRILLDEAHYFLCRPPAGARRLARLTGYTLVTYRLAQLPAELLRGESVVIATRVTDPREVELLHQLRGGATTSTETLKQWAARLQHLPARHAVLLPGAEEAAGEPRAFRLAPRLTTHVRHRQKYLDVPVSDAYAFVFTRRGVPVGPPARSLAEFITLLSRSEREVLRDHARQGDFSRWIADVFGDDELADELRDLEQAYQAHRALNLSDAIAQRIQERYLLADETA